ncbi:MAG: T9SS type A sorting domain-containing protein [candidate division Zixibacteria bacterium]|nr:T9SS type A sorting domain-containing protein [candidate division Zixibacteria bacterium]
MLRCLDTIRPANDAAIRARHPWRALFIRTAFSAALLCARPAAAGELSDLRVNDDAGSAIQADPRVAVAANGTFAVVWSDRRLGANGDIFIQCFDSAGARLGGNRRVSDDPVGSAKAQPAVAADYAGRFVVAWLDYRGGFPIDPQVYLQRFSGAGTPLGGNVRITDTIAIRQAPDLAFSSWGGVLVWGEYSGGHWGILGKRIDTAGNVTGPLWRANTVLDSARHAPRVACSPRGWFVVAWQDKRFGHHDIFVQRFDAAGQRVGPNVKVNADAGSAEQTAPDVAADGAGRFTVVWTDYRNGTGNPDIYAARFDTTMTPLTANLRLNSVGTNPVQRGAAIGADRMGNTVIVWGDSTTSGWDVIGQMVDADGVVREANFAGSTATAGNQYNPDAAADGAYRYVVWTDQREDVAWDIFASVKRYNSPGLTVTPLDLAFDMRVGGPIPPAQTIALDHRGYNALDFEVVSHSRWLTVAPLGGTTPDSVAVAIASDTLPNGVYLGYVRFRAPMASDSAIDAAVRLEVRSARLSVSVDTIRALAPEGYDTVLHEAFTIANDGPGAMTWTAAESAPWLGLGSTGGSAPSVVVAAIDARALAAGTYAAEIVIDAGAAENSPATVAVVLEVRDDLPVLAVAPPAIATTVADPADFDTAFTVANAGGGSLIWSVSGGAAWLEAEPAAGVGPGTVRLTANAGQLAPGANTAVLTVNAPGSYTDSASVGVSLTWAPLRTDTIVVEPATVRPGQSGVTSIRARIHNRLAALVLPLQCSPGLISFDSLQFGEGLPYFLDRYYRIEPAASAIVVQLVRTTSDTALAPGEYLLARIYFTADSVTGIVSLRALDSDSLSPVAVTDEGDTKFPVVQAGRVALESPGGVGEEGEREAAGAVGLSQNFPNPFNSGTTLSFTVPKTSPVRLEVFNVLGRRVAVLAEGVHTPGVYRVHWAGKDEQGGEAPSGVYFYRLETADTALVAKMILVK